MKPVTRARRKNGRERGSAVLEFALCACLLLMIAAGVTDFSRFITAADLAASAAAAGAQYGALSPANYGDLTGMQNAALMDASSFPNATAVASQVCACSVGGSPVSCPANCTYQGESPETYIKVTVNIPFTPLFPYPWIPAATSVASSSTVRVQ